MIGDSLWALLVVGGFIVLGLALAYAKLRNKAADADEPVRRDGPPPHYGETRGDG